MTDFSPLEGGLMDRWALADPVGVVRGCSLGSAEELRVNMKSPNLTMKNAPSAFAAQAQVPRHDVSSSSSFHCLRQRLCGDGEGETQRSLWRFRSAKAAAAAMVPSDRRSMLCATTAAGGYCGLGPSHLSEYRILLRDVSLELLVAHVREFVDVAVLDLLDVEVA